MASVKLVVRIEHKNGQMPAFVVVPAKALAKWKLTATTTIEGTLDGVSLGRRSLKRWDEECWFIELRREFLEALGTTPGDRATLVILRAPTEMPQELQELIATDARARERRARRALLAEAKPPGPRIEGLGAEPRSIRVRILGRSLPGRTCGPYTEVTVALAVKVGGDPTDSIPADARATRWETRIEVRAPGGVPTFRGPAVNGPPRERFLYLTWIGRKGGAAPAMFRRAKLRLDAVPAAVLAESYRSGLLVGRLALTAPDGMPVCASVRPPAIRWASS